MAEPVSSGVGAAAIVKFYGLITILSIAASLAYLIVVMTRGAIADSRLTYMLI